MNIKMLVTWMAIPILLIADAILMIHENIQSKHLAYELYLHRLSLGPGWLGYKKLQQMQSTMAIEGIVFIVLFVVGVILLVQKIRQRK